MRRLVLNRIEHEEQQMAKRKTTTEVAAPQPVPQYAISNCNFTIEDPNGVALLELARAVRANAEAIAAIAARAAVGNEVCALKIVGGEGMDLSNATVRGNGKAH
jgi:hypothetical protein